MARPKAPVPPPYPGRSNPLSTQSPGKWGDRLDRAWEVTKPWLFEIDAEWVHTIFFWALRFLVWVGGKKKRTQSLFKIISGMDQISPAQAQSLSREVFGMDFRNPIGLAAGFDKNAEILPALVDFGFGFVEVGTVTPRPQDGNLKPRLFRDPSEQAIFNRMGFNGAGMVRVRKNLEKTTKRRPQGFRLGLNVGKNKDTPNEEAASDYRKVVEGMKDLADYLVINVSSPNTPGLRALQSVESLKPIVLETLEAAANWSTVPPVLLKLAPELASDGLSDVIRACEKWKVGGFILTNTLAGIWGPTGDNGGWSGQILSEKSKAALVEARSLTDLPIISVGGIGSPEQAYERLKLGANLVQFYTGWIYGGPRFPSKIMRFLAENRT
ncbi:MAG: quinone-dependent dihydroorotate dehydrogenase [Bdellovibrionales bacterium]|nr:quinone-dependent dihydroorotate dehydrogenase [Bdellovibrionales bacterium]